tara:strand:+ start:13701 stop:15098 length:1398 start_codon:yes stop_codon:yes gene_type:complete
MEDATMAYRPPALQIDRNGRAFVSKMIDGERYKIPMGDAGSPACRQAYQEFKRDYKLGTVDWQRPRRYDQPHSVSPSEWDFPGDQGETKLTLAEAIEMFLEETEMRDISGEEKHRYSASLFEIIRLWGRKPVDYLSPKKVKAFRRHLVTYKGWGYSMIWAAETKLRAFLAWAVEEEFADARTHWRISQMKKIKKGELGLAKPKRTAPVGLESLDAITPFLLRTIKDMAMVQFLCGMRPGEVRRLRGFAARSMNPEWHGEKNWSTYTDPEGEVTHFYTFFEHKNMKKTDEPLVKAIPKAAMEILEKHLERENQVSDGEGYLFRPSVAREERIAAGLWTRHTRKTKKTKAEERYCAAQKRLTAAKLDPMNDFYKRNSYNTAIREACKAAIKAGMLEEIWSPNQLRHGIATHLAQHGGLETAQRYLGHAEPEVTRKFYAARTQVELAKVAKMVQRHADEWIQVTRLKD